MYRPTPLFAFFLKTAATAAAIAILGVLFLRAAEHDERSAGAREAAAILQASMEER